MHATILRADLMERRPASNAAIRQRATPVSFILVPWSGRSDARGFAQKLFVPELHFLTHQRRPESRRPRPKARLGHPRIKAVNATLHDPIDTVIERLSSTPVPIIRAITWPHCELLSHLQESLTFFRIDDVFHHQ